MVIRVVVDRKGRLLHGEVVAVEGGEPVRFVGWRQLQRALRLELARYAEGGG
jgi:hypothetical protein